jgi:hypothetical protein
MNEKVNQKERLLDNILLYFQGKTFSQREAVKIVGGLGKLATLIERGEVEADKSSSAPNTKWRLKADQVLRHCRAMK